MGGSLPPRPSAHADPVEDRRRRERRENRAGDSVRGSVRRLGAEPVAGRGGQAGG